MIEVLLQADRALSVGMIDQAERLYSQAMEADPRNAIAVVGLARVALERGDEAEALRLARRALAIDGDNSAAHRMVARLEEVLRYRGQALPSDEAAPVPQPAAVPGPAAIPRPAAPVEPRAPAAPAQAAPTAPPPSPPATPEPPTRGRFAALRRLLRRERR